MCEWVWNEYLFKETYSEINVDEIECVFEFEMNIYSRNTICNQCWWNRICVWVWNESLFKETQTGINVDQTEYVFEFERNIYSRNINWNHCWWNRICVWFWKEYAFKKHKLESLLMKQSMCLSLKQTGFNVDEAEYVCVFKGNIYLKKHKLWLILMQQSICWLLGRSWDYRWLLFWWVFGGWLVAATPFDFYLHFLQRTRHCEGGSRSRSRGRSDCN